MNYFFYNNDANALRGHRRTHVLIKEEIAVSGGPPSFGEQLRQLSTGDTLLMYENRVGVVAVGEVEESWDGKSHRKPIYYVLGQSYLDPAREYRIKVKWFIDLTNSPISFRNVKQRLGYQPRGTVRKIVKRRPEVESMVAECLSSR